MIFTEEELLAARTTTGESLNGCDLVSEAARSAAAVLAENWHDGMVDGCTLASMLHDLDDTIILLGTWRKALEQLCQKP